MIDKGVKIRKKQPTAQDPQIEMHRLPQVPEGKPLAYVKFSLPVTIGTEWPTAVLVNRGTLHADCIRVDDDVFPLISGIVLQYRLK